MRKRKSVPSSTGRQAERQAGRKAGRQKGRQAERQVSRQAEWQVYRQTGMTGRQTDMQTERKIFTGREKSIAYYSKKGSFAVVGNQRLS